MTARLIPLALIAALDDCVTGVDMDKVAQLRALDRDNSELPPIELRNKNRMNFYVIEDGNHRALAAMLNGHRYINAEVKGDPVELSWRWPKIAPLYMTLSLMRMSGATK